MKRFKKALFTLIILGVNGEPRDFLRLFRMPGVTHCANGDGPNQVERLSAIVEWQEKGNPPQKPQAYRLGNGGEKLFSRPLVPIHKKSHAMARGCPPI